MSNMGINAWKENETLDKRGEQLKRKKRKKDLVHVDNVTVVDTDNHCRCNAVISAMCKGTKRNRGYREFDMGYAIIPSFC